MEVTCNDFHRNMIVSEFFITLVPMLCSPLKYCLVFITVVQFGNCMLIVLIIVTLNFIESSHHVDVSFFFIEEDERFREQSFHFHFNNLFKFPLAYNLCYYKIIQENNLVLIQWDKIRDDVLAKIRLVQNGFEVAKIYLRRDFIYL